MDSNLSPNNSYYLNEEVLKFNNKNEFHVLFPEFFEGQSFQDVDRYLRSKYENILYILTNFYNGYTGLNKSCLYWETILGYFIYMFLYLLLPKYKYIIECERNSTFICRDFDKKLVISDAGMFLDLSFHNSLFHENLYSLIISTLGLEYQINNSKYLIVNGDKIKHGSCINLKKFNKNINYLLPFSETYRVVLNVMGIDINTKLRCPFSSSNELDICLREDMSNLEGNDEFERIIFKTLKYIIPVSLLEEIPQFINSAKNKVASSNNKRIITSQGLFLDSYFATVVAESRENGSMLHMSNHGGVQRDFDIIEEWYEKRLSNKYIVANKRDEQEVALSPMTKIPFKARLIKRIKSPKYKVIVIGTEESYFIQKLFDGIFGYRMEKYIEHKLDLLNVLTNYYKYKIFHRGYHKSYSDWDIENKIINAKLEIVSVDVRVSIFSQIAQSELVIFDYLGASSFYHGLLLNIPTMLVFSPKCHKVSQEFQSWYERLADIGIYHSSIDSLNKALIDINSKSSIKKWWNEPKRKAVINQFMLDHSLNKSRIGNWYDFLRNDID
jgi:putative transferase (TIGR04331 family)